MDITDGKLLMISKSFDEKMEKDTARRIGVIGTGNYGRALAKRLVFSGYDVIVGSRRPEHRQLSRGDGCLCDVELTSIGICLQQSDIIFIAIHAENFQDTIAGIADEFKDKIVIDVSNREYICGRVSNAEYLQSIIPEARVVKAFNTVSAYVMENDIAGGSRTVFVASNEPLARDRVCNLARDMGFSPLDFGRLASAYRMEVSVLKLFPGWKIPLFITFVIFDLWALYIAFVYYVNKRVYRWDQIFLKVFNKPLCMTAITVLALTYMPGCLAGFLQMYHGTKHKPFPKILDKWLKLRKQFGMISFVLVVAHVIISVLLMSPTYYGTWFQSTKVHIPANHTDDLDLPFKTYMNWKGEAVCLVGLIAFLGLCFLAISTIPSVGDSFNWREWRFVQSQLGFFVLFLSALHVLIMGAPGWIKYGFPRVFRTITFLSLICPVIVLLMKTVLVMPCVSGYVTKIRKGWERPSGALCSCSRGKTFVVDIEEQTSLRRTGGQSCN